MTDPKLRRRYVYMSDAEWEWLKGRAGLDATISAVVRGLVEDAREPVAKAADWGHAEITEALRPPERTGFRPAPKPERKKR